MNVARIPVYRGGEVAAVAIVDKADEALVSAWRWRLLGNGYVMAQRGELHMYLHRLIAGAGPETSVDHWNQDKLDNRSVNLRLCSRSQNGGNRQPDRRREGTSSRHKGVCWDRSRDRWAAYIHVNGKTRGLGRFDSEDSAAAAYNAAALEAWGEFARLNDLNGGPLRSASEQP
jgi:hypothetical protein